MEYNGIQFLRPDPFLSEGITFLRHDPGWRPYYIPLQTRLTKRYSGLTPSPATCNSRRGHSLQSCMLMRDLRLLFSLCSLRCRRIRSSVDPFPRVLVYQCKQKMTRVSEALGLSLLIRAIIETAVNPDETGNS